jgi:hypothetical protein
MKQVDFIIPGGMKCGTSTLARILRDHPDIDFSRPKEPHFFSKSGDWRKELASYESCFNKPSAKIRGEGSTSYTMYPWFNFNIWEDIFAYNPSMKFIYLVRNPVDRVISHYMHVYERGFVNGTLEDSIRKVPLILNTGRYFTQIDPFVRRFGIEKVMILDFDDLVGRQSETIDRVADFLDVDRKGFPVTNSVHQNPSVGGKKKHHRFDTKNFAAAAVKKLLPLQVWRRLTANHSRAFESKPELSRQNREMIVNMLRLDICALENMMQKDLTHWTRID